MSAKERVNVVLSPKSKWSAEQVAAFLSESRLPVRLSSVGPSGFPHITSLWFMYREGCFLCCTQQEAVVCRNIRREPRVGFEIAVNEPPYYGVSGQGEARVVDADATDLLNDLADQYLEGRDAPLRAWLLSRAVSRRA